jgi:hypothetical protein
MCVICGFDNKPRSKHCIMCGTSYKFTMEYKCEKSEIKKKKLEAKKQRSMFSKTGPTVISRMYDVEVDSVVINRENDVRITPVASVNGDSSVHRPSFGMSLSTPTKHDLERSVIASPELQAILLESSTAPARASLSGVKRREALNYRRLNQLSLRQKSARRRKMWQRQYDPHTGDMVWVRASVKETLIGSAPFGYSPSNSFCEPNNSSLISQSIPFRSQRISSNSDGSVTGIDRTQVLVDAALGRPGPPEKSTTTTSSREFCDSFGDPVLLSSSPGYTSKFGDDGSLTWEKVESRRAVKPKSVSVAAIERVTSGIKPASSSSSIGADGKLSWYCV